MKSVIFLAAALALTGPAAALAQTANASPTSPAPAGLPGVPKAVSRIAPTTGPDHPARVRQAQLPKIVTESDEVYLAEQRKADRGMNICIGCD